jgi:hypothetical protein
MKNWYSSKTYWASIGLMILGLMHYYKTGEIDRSIELILTAMGMIGLRAGWKKIS